MVNLGEKRKNPEEMYSSANKEEGGEEIIHRRIALPLKMLDGKKIKKGDKIEVCIKGEVTEIHDSEYASDFSMKVEEGEIMDGAEEAEEGEEGGTYLGKNEE